MCKHIHLVCQVLKIQEMKKSSDNCETEEAKSDENQFDIPTLIIKGDENSYEKNMILENVSKRQKPFQEKDFDTVKQEVTIHFSAIMNEIHSIEQLEIIKKALQSVEPQVKAVAHEARYLKNFQITQKVNTRKKIDLQRKFPIKNRKLSKVLSVKPTQIESSNIVILTLMNRELSSHPSTSINLERNS